MSNGGLIGLKNTPSNTSAGGVWNLREQMRSKRDGIWPGKPPIIEYPTPTWSDTDTNNWSFASQSIGTDDTENRQYYLLVSYEDAGTNGAVFASAVTVGGISGTNILQQQTLNTQYSKAEIWRVNVPSGSGTTGTVTVTTTGATAPYRLAIGSVVVYNEKGYNVNSATGANASMTLDVKTTGGVLAGFVCRNAVTVTWNNGLIQTFDSASASSELIYAKDDTIPTNDPTATYSVTQSDPQGVLYGISVW